ncbi:MAG: 1-acyl-sn-glycerol-3-phosphate acyltransferase [Bacteroidales bacterium]|jgi:putative hemolysin|nr:1-acyl-sn-glycerol-3-phosphate acyltransferase [Bacteroidales bacterium]
MNENNNITERFISIERVIASKNRYLLKIIPRPLMKAFKKLIHLNEINAIIYKYRNISGTDFATKLVEEEFKVRVIVENIENMPLEGRHLIISNHPLGGMDGLVLTSEVGKIRSDLYFPVNDILCTLPQFKGVFIPINKYGRNTNNHQILNDAFSSDSNMIFFPAGMVSRRFKHGIIKDLEWKHTFIKKSIEYKRDIIPVYTDACNTNFFYRFAKLRKSLGIRFNIELILLPREMFLQRNKTIRLIFGKPIPYTTFDNSLSTKQWAEKVRNYVYSLKEDSQSEFLNS